MRFGENGKDDEQFQPQPKGLVQIYVGPPVRCETCQRRGLVNRAEITVVTDVDEGLFVSICRPCGREYASRTDVLYAIAEHRENYHYGDAA